MNVQFRALGPKGKSTMNKLYGLNLGLLINRIVRNAMGERPLAKWIIDPGMHVTGEKDHDTPYPILKF